MTRLALCIGVLAMLGCDSGSDVSKKPKGTISDPVEVCERAADVCRLDEARLGVCTTSPSRSGLVCTPQH